MAAVSRRLQSRMAARGGGEPEEFQNGGAIMSKLASDLCRVTVGTKRPASKPVPRPARETDSMPISCRLRMLVNRLSSFLWKIVRQNCRYPLQYPLRRCDEKDEKNLHKFSARAA